MPHNSSSAERKREHANASTGSDQEWTLVKSTGKRCKRRHSRDADANAKPVFMPPAPTLPSLSREALLALKTRLQRSAWWAQTRAQLSAAVSEIGQRVQLVHCLGLGSFESSHNARHQLACALAMQELFEVADERCVLGEPRLTACDQLVLRRMRWTRCEWLSHQRVWQRCVRHDGCVLMFLPHCPYHLNDMVLRWICANGFAHRTVLLANQMCAHKPVGIAYARLHEQKCAHAKLSSSETAFNDLCVSVVSKREEHKTVIGLVKEQHNNKVILTYTESNE